MVTSKKQTVYMHHHPAIETALTLIMYVSLRGHFTVSSRLLVPGINALLTLYTNRVSVQPFRLVFICLSVWVTYGLLATIC